MSAVEILVSRVDAALEPSPIKPGWILKGNPTARSKILSWSHDKTAFTVVWDCSPGVFNWIYDYDETIHVLEGSVTLTDKVSGVREIGPGDVVFFPAGSRAKWEVTRHVRKIAFFREAIPKPVSLTLRVIKKARDALGIRSGGNLGSNDSVPAAAA